MQNNLLVEIISTLPKRERNALLQWVLSPAHNTRADVARLCAYLCTHVAYGHTEQSGQALTEAGMLDAVFPAATRKNGALKGREMADVRSWLLGAVKEWLVFSQREQEVFSKQATLCQALRQRGWHKVYQQELRKMAVLAPAHTAENYWQQYRIGFEQWEAQHRQPGADTTALFRAGADFGAFVALNALRHGCAALDKGAAPLSLDYLPETLAAIEAGRYADIPGVQVYYQCFRLMLTADLAHFYALRDLLARHSSEFPAGEIRDVWMVAINYCIRRVNAGVRETWAQEALELYQKGLDLQIVMENGRLTRATYHNILLLALSTQAWAWAWDFLHQYRKYLAPGEQHTGFHFGLATWYFRQLAYDAAQEILRSVEFRDAGMNLDARRMLVRIYFDRNEPEALDALLHSFRTYLQRHRNIGYHRDLNVNFLYIVNRLIRLQPGDAAGREKIARKIRELPLLAEREWLLEKATD